MAQGRVLLAAAAALAAGVLGAWWWQSARPAAVAAEGVASTTATAASAAAVPAPAAAVAEGPVDIPQLDLRELLQQQARDWRAARLRGNPAVLVIEFPSLREQGAAMNRAAALIEKAGAPRDKVLSDAALQALIERQGDTAQSFYQGHNYVAEQLARFFALAARQGQGLNAQEQRLKRLLADAHAVSGDGEATVAKGLQAVISFTAAQHDVPSTPGDETVDERRRESVLRHELSHGLFFTSREYRDHCWRFWRDRLSHDEREALRSMLARLHYDPGNEELMVNEAQAFLMHTPDERAFNADSLGLTAAKLADLRKRFLLGAPKSLR